ncbi:hypothetical protein AX16_009288 [Volvariella volvacea WC 439]|nr:hypothetical protein AX16_009288 [Volvariella volvacea WC 439]
MKLSPHLESQIAHVDAEIARLKAHLIQLHRRRNALMPLSRLPLELVTSVLQHLIEEADTPQATRPNSEVTPFFSWTTATQVYAHWRNAALGCPGLWTYLSTTNLAWFKAFLQRSRNQSVCIDTSQGKAQDGEYDEMLQLLASNMQRVRSLTLLPECGEKKLLTLRNIPAPQLEILKCNVRGIMVHGHARVESPQPDIMSKLRKLEIASGFEGLASFLPHTLSTVTNLNLRRLLPNDELEIIKRCMSVCHLVIEGTWTSAVSNDLNQLAPIPVVLPNLVSLRSLSPSLPMLASLALPALRKIDIRIYFSNDNVTSRPPQQFPILAKILEPFIDDYRTFTRLDHFSLIFGGSFNKFEYTVKGMNATGEELVSLAIEYSSFNRLRDEPTSDTPILLGLIELARMLRIPIRAMDVRGSSRRDFQEVFYLFRDRLDVTKICLRDTGVDNMLVIFLSLPYASNPPCSPPLPTRSTLPPTTSQNPWVRLESLSRRLEPTKSRKEVRFCDCEHCRNIRMTAYSNLGTLVLEDFKEEEMIKHYEPRWLELFLGWLRERKEIGLGLVTLRLVRCTFNQEYLDTLNALLPNVVIE